MTPYLFIESRDPFEHAGVPHTLGLAIELFSAGHPVTLFLVENAVLAARRSPASESLSELAARGISVLADDFSLRERGIGAERLARGVRPAPIDSLVERLEAGDRAMWH